MELVFEQAKIETKEEREHVKGLEQKVVIAYEKIPKNTQIAKLIATENIDWIV
jgi:restriction endonuclease